MGSQLPDLPGVLVQEVEEAFERGLQWSLHVEPKFLGADSKMMVLAGLHVIDSRRVPEVRRAFGQTGAADPVDLLFAAFERDPLPLSWDEPDPFQRFTPSSLPQRPEERLRMNGAMSQGALVQAAQGRLEEPILSWMRQDLWGYDLDHQFLAWILALKRGHRAAEAGERILRLGARIWHELEHSQLPSYYDLLTEGSILLAFAGFPIDRLAGRFRTILSSQGADGGWWFTANPADFHWLLDHAHLDASSPLSRSAKNSSQGLDPALTRQRLETSYRGHSTGLSLWGLGILLQRQGLRPA